MGAINGRIGDPDDGMGRGEGGETWLVEAAEAIGEDLIQVIRSANPHLPEMRVVYGVVGLVRSTTEHERGLDDVDESICFAQALVTSSAGESVWLATDYEMPNDRGLANALVAQQGRPVVVLIAPPVAGCWGKVDGVIVAIVSTPLDAPGPTVAVTLCTLARGFGAGRMPATVHLIKPY